MRLTKNDKRHVQAEEAILNAAMNLLPENPRAGMSEIALAAGVGRATLYRHYETRVDLIKALAVQCMEETDLALLPIAHLRGRAAIEAIFELLMPLANRFRFLTALWSQIEDDEELAEIESQMSKDMIQLIKQAKQDGEINPEHPDTWLAAFFESTFTAGWTLVSQKELTTERAAIYAKKAFFDGCSVR